MTTRKVVADRYEILDLIARGGMALVYRAYDRRLSRYVALKVLHPEFASDPRFVERFKREAHAAASLSHPGIVSVFDWGNDGETYYIVMEYVEGRTLRDVLKKEGRLHFRRAAEIAAQAALALDAAHRKGIVHRDVKPGNVMLTRSGDAKVADFGIARAVGTDEALTQAGSVLGTASYLSPEQADGRPVDQRSDIYSLGVVLFEMLTGRPPFRGDSPLAVALKHLSEAPPRPTELCPDIPPALEAIVLKAMAKDPAARYNTAMEMHDDLKRLLSGGEVRALSEPVFAPAASDEVETDESRDRRGGPGKLFWAAVVVLLALLVYGLYLLGVSLGVFGAPREVRLPNVVGRPFEPDARLQLESLGLEVVASYRPSAPGDKGRVLSQDPPAGSLVPPRSQVRLVVGEGPGMGVVPDLVGKTRADAERAIQEAGFVLGEVTERFDPEAPEGTVLEQDPPGGRQTTRGTPISLVVSAGPEKVEVPDVVGTSREQAARLLAAAGLALGNVREEASARAAGTVIAQSPGAGTEAKKGSRVDIVVSSGPPPKEVPRVVGLSRNEAADRLAAEGFRAVTRSCYAGDSRTTDGTVVAQDPPGGSKAAEGSTVTLTIASTADTTAPPC